MLPVCEYEEFYHKLIENLIEKTIFYDSSKNFTVKGNRGDWAGLPKSKSLFFSKTGYGLPIGNLTSQLFGNIYLNEFDHYVKRNLKIKYYGRYVDDMVFVHRDKEYLKTATPRIRNYLKKNLALSLHEKKIYLQHNSRGVDFLGTIIKPYRIYIKNRTKGNFYNLIRDWNKFLKENENKLTKNEIKDFLAGMNSYLGIMSHYDTAKLRQKLIGSLSVYFWNFVYIENGFLKRRLKF